MLHHHLTSDVFSIFLVGGRRPLVVRCPTTFQDGKEETRTKFEEGRRREGVGMIGMHQELGTSRRPNSTHICLWNPNGRVKKARVIRPQKHIA
mmetsp:Transcript_24129/g.51458  ORF Transcript_24129/g.51458 Transcript_24129/m.51458 type:complete len:93 (+) Transcript_24129:3-281(+)